MTNIIKFDGFDSNEIRTTEDGRFSVYDVIKFCGKKNPHDAWKSLCEQFPEVLGKSDNFKFPGKGQRQTPVADRAGILQIIGLLPGAVGRSYREAAAKVLCSTPHGINGLGTGRICLIAAKTASAQRLTASMVWARILAVHGAGCQCQCSTPHGINGLGTEIA